jgi:hypothetical protein
MKNGKLSLEELLVDGLETGGDVPLNKEFWKNLRREAERMVQEHAGKKRTSSRLTCGPRRRA